MELAPCGSGKKQSYFYFNFLYLRFNLFLLPEINYLKPEAVQPYVNLDLICNPKSSIVLSFQIMILR